MSDIRRQYEQNFGPLRALDPLDLPPLPDIEGEAQALIGQYSGGASPAARDLPPLWELGAGAKPAEPEGEGGLGTLFGASTVGVVEALAGAGEYLANQGERKLREAAPGVVPEVGLATPFRAGRQFLGNIREEMYKTLSPETMERLGREWDTLDPTKSILRFDDPLETAAAVGTQLVEAVPSSLATLLPAAIMFRMGASPAAIAYLGASEATLSMGGIANQIDEEIAGAREDELMQSPRYVELRGTMSESDARAQLTAEVQGARPLIAGLLVGAISSVSGRLLTPVLGDGATGSILSRAARGFAAEAPQEASQSSVEQYVQNIAAQTFDKSRSATEGVANAAISGGVLGGLIGGGTTALLGRSERPAVPSEAPPAGASTEEDTGPPEGRGTPGESFESVFGPTPGGVGIGPTQTQGDLFTPAQSAADAANPAVAAAIRAREQFTTRVAQPYNRQGQATGSPVMLQDSGELQVEREQAATAASARAQAERELAKTKPKPISPKAPADAKARVAAANVRWRQAVEARTQELMAQAPQGRPPAAPNEAQVDMFEYVPIPGSGGIERSVQDGGLDPGQMALRQDALGLPKPPPRDITMQPELTQPIPGGTMSLLPPARGQLPQPPAERDLSQPPGILPDERQADLFDDTPVVQEVQQPDEAPVAPTEYEVTAVNRNREVYSRETYPTLAEAEAAADALRDRAAETGASVIVKPRQRAGGDAYRLVGRDADGNTVVNEAYGDTDAAQAALARYSANPDFNEIDFSIAASTSKRRQPEAEQPDDPTAEPLLDIEAQLDDMEDETSDRLGVYLSPQNLQRLNRDRASDVVRGRGVQLGNFDGKGGLLIVRDREVADTVLQMRDEGQDMQEILGLVTRAGIGKPLGGRYVVQERTANGAVVRETLVNTYAEAEALAEEIGDRAFIVSSQQALRRRAQMIEKERKQRGKKKAETKARDEFLEQTDTLLQEGRITGAEEAEALKAKTPARAAARLVGRTVKGRAAAVSRRIGGFVAPEDLTFNDGRYADLYQKAFDQLRGFVALAKTVKAKDGAKPKLLNIYDFNDVAAFRNVADRIQYALELERLDTVLDTLSKARQLGKPTEKLGDTRGLEVARELAPGVAAGAKTQLPEAFDDDLVRSVFDTVEVVPEDELVKLVTLATRPGALMKEALPSDKELAQAEALLRIDELFAQAVNYAAGLPRKTRVPADAAARLAAAGRKIVKQNERVEALKKELASAKRKKDKTPVKGLEDQLGALRNERDKAVRQYLLAAGMVEEASIPASDIERLKLSPEEIEDGATAAGEMLTGAELTSALADEGIQFDIAVSQILTGDKDIVKELYDRAKTPGEKRKFIQRIQVMYQTRQNEGRARQAKFVRDQQTGAKRRIGFSGQMITGATVAGEATSAYSADALTNFWRVQDETPTERKERQARAEKVRAELQEAIKMADEFLAVDRSDVRGQRDENGQLTEEAIELGYAMAYFRALRDYAIFAANTNNTSTPALNQIEDLIEFIEEIVAKDTANFTTAYSRVMKGALRSSLRMVGGEDAFRKFVLNRDKAIKDAAKQARTLTTIREGRELTEMGIQKSMYFRDMVLPLMNRFIDAFMVDGWFSYQPTVAEMDRAQYAITMMARNKATKGALTERTQKFFEGLGYTFDENGVLQYEESSAPPAEGQQQRLRGERYTKITDANLDKAARLKYDTLLDTTLETMDPADVTTEISPPPLRREGTASAIYEGVVKAQTASRERVEKQADAADKRDRVLGSRIIGILGRYSQNLAAARTVGAAQLAEERMLDAFTEIGVDPVALSIDSVGVRVLGYDVTVPLVRHRLERSQPASLSEIRALGRDMEIPDLSFPLKPQELQVSTVVSRLVPEAETRVPDRVQKLAELYARVTGVIDRFQKRVSNTKTTINGMVRAEQRMVRALQALGVWRQGKTPAVGTIEIGDKSRSVRLVAEALQAKTLLKPQAKEIMMSVKAPVEPSAVTAARRTATAAARDQLAATEAAARAQTTSEETDLFLRSIDPALYEEEFTSIVDEIDAAINTAGSGMRAVDALDVFMRKIPKGHPFHAIAQRLLSSNLDDVVIRYDFGRRLKKKAAASFVRNMGGQPTVLLRFYDDTGLNPLGDALKSYTVLHELTHAATHGALRNKPWLALELTGLREHVRQYLEETMGGLPPTEYVRYGLEKIKLDGRPNPIDEFLAEAWTNLELRAILKRIPAPKLAAPPTLGTRIQTAWDAFKAMVRRALGLPEPIKPIETSVLDVIFEMTDELFTGEKVDTGDMLEARIPDAILRAPAAQLLQEHMKIGSFLKRVREMAVPPLGAMSMEQIRDLYGDAFRGAQDSSLVKYMDAYFKRAAENSRLMERAEKIVQRWTSLQQNNVEAATELSRVATVASLYRVSPGEALTSKRNEHLKEPAAKARWAELNKRYLAMPAEYRKMYDDLQSYYRNALDEESTLILQNALRSVLATGAGAPLDIETFEQNFTLAKLKGITTEKLNEMLGDMATADMKGTITQLARLPDMRQGDYFPLMRYGDFVVFASREKERKSFGEDNKAAQAYAAKIRGADPTLDVGVFKNNDGFVVRVTEKEFSTAETRSEAAQLRERMVAQYGADAVSDVQLRSTFQQDAVIQSNSALGSILGKLEGNKAAQSAMKNFYLRSLADSSFRKHEIHRKNREGVDYDVQHRNFANYAKQSSYYTSQLQYGWQLGRFLREMDEFAKQTRGNEQITAVRRGEVVRELQMRDEQTADPPDIMNAVKRGTEFAQFMALTTPAYWMTNATQPWMTTTPWLAARYGWKNASSALLHAQNLIKTPLMKAVADSKGGISALRKQTGKIAAEQAFSVIDQIIAQLKADSRLPDGKADAYIEMLTQLRRNNIIDLSWIAELRDIAEGQDVGLTQRVLDASRIMSHLTEVNNRVMVAIAAYDLKYNEVVQQVGEAEADRQAVDYAKTAVSTTQFNYGGANKPRWFQTNGPLGAGAPLLTQFMQWPQHMYALMIMNAYKWSKGDKEAKRVILNMLATHALAAGMTGVMFQPIKWAIGLALMLGGDDDEPYDASTAISGQAFDWWFQKNLAELTGSPALAEAATKGIPAALGVDMSQRLAMGSIFMADLRPENADSFLGSVVTSFGGPWIGIGVQWGRGFMQVQEAVANGDVKGFFRGLEFVTPKIVRDLIRTGRFATQGITSTRGDVLIPSDDVGPVDLFIQSMGLSPTTTSRFYDKRDYLTRRARMATERKQDLVTRIVGADSSDQGRLISEAVEHNKLFPDAPISISGLIQAMRNKREREARTQIFGANLDEKQAAIFADEGEFLR